MGKISTTMTEPKPSSTEDDRLPARFLHMCGRNSSLRLHAILGYAEIMPLEDSEGQPNHGHSG